MDGLRDSCVEGRDEGHIEGHAEGHIKGLVALLPMDFAASHRLRSVNIKLRVWGLQREPIQTNNLVLNVVPFYRTTRLLLRPTSSYIMPLTTVKKAAKKRKLKNAKVREGFTVA